MTDFIPGQPEDRRLPAQVARASASYVGDFELAAARVIARLTGELVILQDDNSKRRMADIQIAYAGRTPGYAEVTLDLDESYAAMASEVRKRAFQVKAPSLGRVWWVTLSSGAAVKTQEKTLARNLGLLAAAGDLFEIVATDQNLGEHSNPLIRQLFETGVVHLASRATIGDEVGFIHILPEGTGGPVGIDWEAFDAYIAEFLANPRRKDVLEKLAATDAAERHAFVGLSFNTPWNVFHALDRDYRELPTNDPRLPPEITHLWLWSYPLGRCLAWFPDRGWFNPQYHWATE
ncbi:hypothetical protein [Dactylosporangium sp. CS-033363]|uniref:hypothetical protein n=1 Tax=Dactylosporangium sp. CS-033363 TaxID=3239935 RepID=UPI003D907A67